MSGILDALLGGALELTTGIDPMVLGLGVGALGAASTGNLGAGIMAGLGAYGGAGMVGGLENLGTAAEAAPGEQSNWQKLQAGASSFANTPTMSALGGWKPAAAIAASSLIQPQQQTASATPIDNTIRPYTYSSNAVTPTGMAGSQYTPGQNTAELRYFNPTYTAGTPYQYTYADGGGVTALAGGGMGQLGSYGDGGQLLRGPGDGVSDSIPAQIGANQPARLADGEFVVPARIVSELGNGSTDAGARQLYKMLDRVQNARRKTTGKEAVAHDTNSAKYLPA